MSFGEDHDLESYPAVMSCNNDKCILIVSRHSYCKLNIYKHYIEPAIERIMWIAFYKNDNNNHCLIKKLPKELLFEILYFLGKELYLSSCIKI